MGLDKWSVSIVSWKTHSLHISDGNVSMKELLIAVDICTVIRYLNGATLRIRPTPTDFETHHLQHLEVKHLFKTGLWSS